MLKFGRFYERENIRDDSNIIHDFDKYLNQSASFNKFNTVEAMVEDLANRSGLQQYIKLINAELENTKTAELNSLLDIKDVKDAIDQALNLKHYTSYVTLLKKLEEQIKNNSNIPETLKNVFSDKKLIDYVSDKIKEIKNDLSYNEINLLINDNPQEITQNTEPYFNFNSHENQK